MLLEHRKMGLAFGITLLSYIRAEKKRISNCTFRFVQNIFDLTVTTTTKIISPSLLLDPENVGVAVGISLLSCIQAEIPVIAHVLPVTSGHLLFTSQPDVGDHLHQSQRVAGPRKCVDSRWNFSAILCTSSVIRISSLQAAILDFPLLVASGNFTSSSIGWPSTKMGNSR